MQDLVGFGTLGVAIIVAALTAQQVWINKLQLRHTLFERRFAIFKAAQRYVSEIMREGTLSDQAFRDLYPEILDAWQRSRFLFGEDVSEYIDTIRRRSLELRAADRAQNHEKEDDHLAWICDQSPELFHRFQPYMQFATR